MKLYAFTNYDYKRPYLILAAGETLEQAAEQHGIVDADGEYEVKTSKDIEKYTGFGVVFLGTIEQVKNRLLRGESITIHV